MNAFDAVSKANNMRDVITIRMVFAVISVYAH